MGKTPQDPVLALVGELWTTIGTLKRRLRKMGQSGELTPAQKSVVLLLERDGPATVSRLAKAENVRHQSMRITVASLERIGAVRSEPDPADGRQKYFQLTAVFLQTLKTGRAAREDWLYRAIQARLTSREQQELTAAVKLLNKLATF